MASKSKSHRRPCESANVKGGISFLAFLLSIFMIYISIFYIFNLSLSTLFNNNKFWFCISNTLILIIAADYGVFSPSKQKHDFDDHHDGHHHYEDYMHSKQTSHIINTNASPLASLNLNENPKKIIIPKEEIKEVIAVDQGRENPEDKLQIIIEGRDHPDPSSQNKDFEQTKIPAARTCRRSKSEKAKRTSVLMEERKIRVRRSETLKNEAANYIEENEFSRMTDEELNRRVEEFIQRFNRQIRLQAAATKTNPN